LREKASNCRVSCAARARSADLAEVAAHFGRLFHAQLRQLAVAQDDAQQVVEIVRHAAGELTDRLDLLRLQEPLFEPLLDADVAHHADRAADRAAGIEHRRVVPFERRLAAVAARQPPPRRRHLLAGERAAEVRQLVGRAELAEHALDRGAYAPRRRQPGELLHGRVPHLHAPRGIDADDAVEAAAHQRLGHLPALPDRFDGAHRSTA
jgi:hypothetical protein